MKNLLDELNSLDITELISKEKEIKNYTEELHRLLSKIDQEKKDIIYSDYIKSAKEILYKDPIFEYYGEDGSLFGTCFFETIEQFDRYKTNRLKYYDSIERYFNYKDFNLEWQGNGHYIIFLKQEYDRCDYVFKYNYKHISTLNDEEKKIVNQQKPDYINEYGENICLKQL